MTGIFKTLPQGIIYLYSDIFRTLCNAYILRNLAYSKCWDIQNHSYFSKALHLRSLTVFWIRLSLNKYSLTCRVTSRYSWYIFRTLSIIVNSDIFRNIHVLFRHIQLYSGIFRTLCSSFIFRTLSYSESWHIYNIRYIQNSVTLSRHIMAYWEHCYI